MHQSHVSAFSKPAGVINKEIDTIVSQPASSKDDHAVNNNSGQHHQGPPFGNDSIPIVNASDTSLMSKPFLEASTPQKVVSVHASLDKGSTKHESNTASEPHLLLTSLDEVKVKVQRREGSVELFIEEDSGAKNSNEVQRPKEEIKETGKPVGSKGQQNKKILNFRAPQSKNKGSESAAVPTVIQHGVGKINSGGPQSKSKGSESASQLPTVIKQGAGKINADGPENSSPSRTAPGIETLGAIKEEDVVNITQALGELNDWRSAIVDYSICTDLLTALHDVEYISVAGDVQVSDGCGEFSCTSPITLRQSSDITLKSSGMSNVTGSDTEYSVSSDDGSL